MRCDSFRIKRIGSKTYCRGVVLIVMLLLLSLNCRKVDRNDNNNQQQEEWDPRNVSRNYTQSFAPSIAVAHDGTIYIVWEDGSKSLSGWEAHIYFRYRLPDGNWSDMEIISDTANWDNEWMGGFCTLDRFGNLHVIWEAWKSEDKVQKICYRARNQAGEWSPIQYLAEGYYTPIGIKADPEGGLHIILEDANRFLYSYKPPGGTWSTPVSVLAGDANVTNYDFTVDSEGKVHVVAGPALGDDGPINYLYRSPDGTWSTYINVAGDRSPRGYAQIAVDRSGKIWISWVQVMPDRTSKICYVYKTPEGDWSLPDTLTDILGNPLPLCIEFDDSGNLHYTWGEGKPGPFASDIFYRVYRKDGVWTSIENISNNPGTWSYSPEIAFGPLGVYIVWVEEEKLEKPVYDAVYYNSEIYLEILSK